VADDGGVGSVGSVSEDRGASWGEAGGIVAAAMATPALDMLLTVH